MNATHNIPRIQRWLTPVSERDEAPIQPDLEPYDVTGRLNMIIVWTKSVIDTTGVRGEIA